MTMKIDMSTPTPSLHLIYNLASPPCVHPLLPFSLSQSSSLSPPKLFLTYPSLLRSKTVKRDSLELANHRECVSEIQPPPTEETAAERNRWVVLRLYEALNARDVDTVQKLLAPDIEWWFHGPPAHQYMMRLLTGVEDQTNTAFEFLPLSVEALGADTVLVEGSAGRSLFWVHAWTVSNGVITQVREYFNTTVTVTCVGAELASTTNVLAPPLNFLPVWQSKLPDRAGKSMPGLVLAI